MAKYTELLAEYLENGGTLPAVFEQIEGFTDLFTGEYIDCEIGFETDALFSIKLEQRAALVMPAYIERISEIEEAYNILKDPTKTRVKSGNISRKYGERTNGRAEQPYNINANVPSAFQNPAEVFTELEHTDTETYNNVTDTESGYTPSEAGALIQALENQVFILKRQLLKEFDNLFMKVY